MKAKELAFMGKITAGATHEMNNVLATIRESGGLLQDLMGLCQDSSFPYREKFLKVLTNIDDQVRRGVELATKLNKFSHSMDNPETRIDAQTILQLNLFLMHRFARLKQVTLAMSPGDENPELVTNPPVPDPAGFVLGNRLLPGRIVPGRRHRPVLRPGGRKGLSGRDLYRILVPGNRGP